VPLGRADEPGKLPGQSLANPAVLPGRQLVFAHVRGGPDLIEGSTVSTQQFRDLSQQPRAGLLRRLAGGGPPGAPRP